MFSIGTEKPSWPAEIPWTGGTINANHEQPACVRVGERKKNRLGTKVKYCSSYAYSKDQSY
jgi:hypothetical protein